MSESKEPCASVAHIGQCRRWRRRCCRGNTNRLVGGRKNKDGKEGKGIGENGERRHHKYMAKPMADENKRCLDKTTYSGHKRVVGEATRGTGFPSNPSVERTRFKACLHTIKKGNTATCPHCKQGEDDAEHTLFCPKWEKERRQTQKEMGIVLNSDNIVQTMLEREEQ